MNFDIKTEQISDDAGGARVLHDVAGPAARLPVERLLLEDLLAASRRAVVRVEMRDGAAPGAHDRSRGDECHESGAQRSG
jgi:hypothetical protein